MSLYRTQAIALDARPGNDADRLVTLFTAQFGLITARVRGLARSRSHYGSAMELMCHTDVELHKRTETQPFFLLTQCAILHTHSALRATLADVATSSLIAEALVKLVPHEDHQPILWTLLVKTLAALETTQDRWPVLICFLCHLMRCTGYWPQWETCLDTGKPPTGTQVYYWPQEGGVVDNGAIASGVTLPSMPYTAWHAVAQLSRAKLAALPALTVTPPMRDAIWTILDLHWRTHLEWESNALRFLRSVVMERAAPETL